jgi:hypothetical protein
MRSEVIILRVTRKMKKDIELLAVEARRTVSDYMRILIEDTIKERLKV